jgi:hypothetical protein
MVGATLVREQGHFFDVFSGDLTRQGDLCDSGYGNRLALPGRPFIATVEIQNLLDSHFHYQDTDSLYSRISPRRTFLARITFRL